MILGTVPTSPIYPDNTHFYLQFFFLCGNLFISMVVGFALGLLYLHPFAGIERALMSETKYDAFLVASHPFLNDVREIRPTRLYSTLEAMESAPDLTQNGIGQPMRLYPSLSSDTQMNSDKPPKYDEQFEAKKSELTTEL